jgi:hypothetical protein
LSSNDRPAARGGRARTASSASARSIDSGASAAADTTARAAAAAGDTPASAFTAACSEGDARGHSLPAGRPPPPPPPAPPPLSIEENPQGQQERPAGIRAPGATGRANRRRPDAARAAVDAEEPEPA